MSRISRIMGYDVTYDVTTLMAFIDRARKAYQALEETVLPVDAKIKELGEDWDLRAASFWLPVLKEHLPAIRRAETACMQLFEKEQSQTAPIPILFSAHHISYRSGLYSVEHEVEEVGILLTAFVGSKGSRSIEGQIRERQRLLEAIRRLSKAVHAAVDGARVGLDQAPEAQARLLAPAPQRQANNRRLHLQKKSDPTQEEGAQGDDC